MEMVLVGVGVFGLSVCVGYVSFCIFVKTRRLPKGALSNIVCITPLDKRGSQGHTYIPTNVLNPMQQFYSTATT